MRIKSSWHPPRHHIPELVIEPTVSLVISQLAGYFSCSLSDRRTTAEMMAADTTQANPKAVATSKSADGVVIVEEVAIPNHFGPTANTIKKATPDRESETVKHCNIPRTIKSFTMKLRIVHVGHVIEPG